MFSKTQLLSPAPSPQEPRATIRTLGRGILGSIRAPGWQKRAWNEMKGCFLAQLARAGTTAFGSLGPWKRGSKYSGSYINCLSSMCCANTVTVAQSLLLEKSSLDGESRCINNYKTVLSRTQTASPKCCGNAKTGAWLTPLREWAGQDLTGLEHFSRISKAEKKSVTAARGLGAF